MNKHETMKTVTLEKVFPGSEPSVAVRDHYGVLRSVEVGTHFTYTYKSQTPAAALREAWNRLGHDLKGENVMNWKLLSND